MSESNVTLKNRDFKGSKLRCLMLTNSPQKQIARCLTELVQPLGAVDCELHNWMPGGFLQPSEARLGEEKLFLFHKDRESLTDWWLAAKGRANTPNWDLVASCKIEGKDGLILVEAKAHKSELNSGGKKVPDPESEGSRKNHERISAAIEEANRGLNAQSTGWKLSHKTHYQLCNRFAWSWKLASLGIPVILVYLGFLNADEMPVPFSSADEWSVAVREYSRGVVPDSAWGGKLVIGNTPIYPMIRSLDLKWVQFGDVAGGKR